MTVLRSGSTRNRLVEFPRLRSLLMKDREMRKLVFLGVFVLAVFTQPASGQFKPSEASVSKQFPVVILGSVCAPQSVTADSQQGSILE